MPLDLTAVGSHLFNVQSIVETVGGLLFSFTGSMVAIAVAIRMIKGNLSGRAGRNRNSSRSMTARYGRPLRRRGYKNHVYDKW